MNNEWIFIRPLANENYEWLIHNPRHPENSVIEKGFWSDIEAHLTSYPCVVLIPTNNILLTQVNIPRTNLARKRLAIPFALEEQLLEPVEELQFAFPAQHNQTPLPVAVISRALLNKYLELIKQAHASCLGIIPDIFVLPYAPDTWNIFIDEIHTWIRVGKYQGFIAETNSLLDWMHRALEETNPEAWPKELVCFSADLNNPAALSLRDLSIPLQQKTINGGLLSFITHQSDFDLPINLLQGEFQPIVQQNPSKKRWYWAIGLASFWIILLTVQLITQYSLLTQQQQQIDENITALYKQVYPNATNVVLPKIRLMRTLNELQAQGTSGGFLNLFTIIANALRQIPEITLTNITFHTNEMDLTLQAKNFQALDKAKKQLMDTGLNVTQEYAASQDNVVNARLRIAGENT